MGSLASVALVHGSGRKSVDRILSLTWVSVTRKQPDLANEMKKKMKLFTSYAISHADEKWALKDTQPPEGTVPQYPVWVFPRWATQGLSKGCTRSLHGEEWGWGPHLWPRARASDYSGCQSVCALDWGHTQSNTPLHVRVVWGILLEYPIPLYAQWAGQVLHSAIGGQTMRTHIRPTGKVSMSPRDYSLREGYCDRLKFELSPRGEGVNTF